MKVAEDVVINVSNLRFAWNDGAPVLDVPMLQVKAGERLFIRGPSGSGKSTLLGLLAGVTRSEQGTVAVLGQDLGRLSDAQRDHFRSDHVGVIFQMFNLIPYLSVIENVTLPCRFSRRRRERARRRASDLNQEAIRLLSHLDMAQPGLLSRPVTDLSVGQQQRVAAARALMGAPELVIADEPTSSLDADLRGAFVRLLFRECADAEATLVFVSHDSALGSQFDRSIDFAELNRVRTTSRSHLQAVS